MASTVATASTWCGARPASDTSCAPCVSSSACPKRACSTCRASSRGDTTSYVAQPSSGASGDGRAPALRMLLSRVLQQVGQLVRDDWQHIIRFAPETIEAAAGQAGRFGVAQYAREGWAIDGEWPRKVVRADDGDVLVCARRP